ncbi:phospholipid phosphatase 1-like isoform X1 [Actinia tenebrosa]|uniref:Phospholipid phosphatase 1-like isoform X1 n=1 Tax=Actinia tenebrosa TaxID=6105 RepID=A0A6P8JA35_ACTTE|nr:phospholipid phosphatase 1-like isoform X1 [Actinia tenebrosa]
MAYPTSCFCISIEVLCFFGVIILDVVLYEFTVLSKGGIQPFKRGFFCNDQSIMKPYKSQSLTFAGLFSAGVVTSLAVIIIHEVGNHFTKPKHTREPIFKEKKQFGVAKIPTFIIRMLHRMALFITGFLAMLLFCDAVQLLTGRLRPHFLAVCKPNATLFNCSTGYITADVCTGDPLKIKYARLSFPSIHTASTAYSLVFIAICLQAIVYLRTLKIFRLLLQAVMFLLAIAVGLSRIKDNYHHWSDVVAGALIGTFTAWLVAVKAMRLLDEPKPNLDYTMLPISHDEEETTETIEKDVKDLEK